MLIFYIKCDHLLLCIVHLHIINHDELIPSIADQSLYRFMFVCGGAIDETIDV